LKSRSDITFLAADDFCCSSFTYGLVRFSGVAGIDGFVGELGLATDLVGAATLATAAFSLFAFAETEAAGSFLTDLAVLVFLVDTAAALPVGLAEADLALFARAADLI